MDGEFHASPMAVTTSECNCGYWEPYVAGFDMDLVAEHLKLSGVGTSFHRENYQWYYCSCSPSN